MTTNSRQCTLHTSTNRINFYVTSQIGRFNDGKSLTNTISLDNTRVTQQDDGTGASKSVSRVINSTLKHQGWVTIRVTQFGGNYLHFFKVGNNTYCNAYQVKSYMTGPIMLGVISTMNVKTQEQIDNYIQKCMNSVPEVLACLTNNLKYNYYYKQSKETSLLMIDVISSSEIAIQLYEGCWIPMKQTTFRTLYSAGNGRINKFTFISPEELYFICTGEHLTDVQIKLMYAYLMQNTSETLVTKRSLQLLDDLPKMFPSKIHKSLIEQDKRDSSLVIMIVKGNKFEWAISGHVTGVKQTGRQTVNSYFCVSLKNYVLTITDEDGHAINAIEIKGYSTLKEHIKEDTMFRFEPKESCYNLRTLKSTSSVYFCEESDEIFYFSGSICIDQRNTDVSIGDQFASRAMAFLNDTASFQRVSTMRSYQRIEVLNRVDVNALSKLQVYIRP